MPLRGKSSAVGCVRSLGAGVPRNGSAKLAARSAPQGLLCDAFTKAGNGDWVATKDVLVPGPGGVVLVKGGPASER